MNDMKKIVYSLFTIILLAFSGCVQDNILQPEPPAQAGDEVTVRFSVNIPKYKTITTRAANGGVNDLNLLVFDEESKFIYFRTATLISQTKTSGTFKVMMQPTTKPRTIHFISNYDFFPDDSDDSGDFYNQSLGKTEQEVITALESESLLFWNRTVLTGGIGEIPDPGQFNGGQPVELLRNQAKISVESTEPKFEITGFALYKIPNKGTAAPFDDETEEFAIGKITPSAGVTLLSNIPGQLDFTMDEKYLFERIQGTLIADYTAVIVEGKYKETPDSTPKTYYYKIDLLDKSTTPPMRHDIERNYHYKVTIENVNMAGASDIGSAANGDAANNVLLDASLDKFPMITDGKEEIEIEKTVVLFVEPGELSVQTNHWPNIVNHPDSINNSGMALGVVEEVEEGGVSIFEAPPVVNNGLITARIADPLPMTRKEAFIVISKGNISRKLRVIVMLPFHFDPKFNGTNPGIVKTDGKANQDDVAELTFTIPDDFPEELLPLEVKIYTQGLYYAKPKGDPNLQMKVENGVICYIHTVTSPGKQTLTFKTNNAGNAETVVLKADGFVDGLVAYNCKEQKGDIFYVKDGVQTPVPYADRNCLTISNGFITIKPGADGQGVDGKFIWNCASEEKASVEAVKWENNKEVLYQATDVETSATTIKLNFTRVIQATGDITYDENGKPVPAGTTLEVTPGRGQIEVTEDGKYHYTLPDTFDETDEVMIQYENKISDITNGTIIETYELTTTVSDLTTGVINIKIKSSDIVITGTIQYDKTGWNSGLTDMKHADNDKTTKTAGPGTFAMTGDGKYKLTIPANTADDTDITIKYRKSYRSTYLQTKTFSQLKTDAGWKLEEE